MAARLHACGRRGRWREALRLLEELEASPGGASTSSYRSVLLACRKHKRHVEAADVLERMGTGADTQAYNEVMHLLRLQRDFAAAEQLWERMIEVGLPRDALSFYHRLHICAEHGKWKEALALLAQLESQLGAQALTSGHVLATMRACTPSHARRLSIL